MKHYTKEELDLYRNGHFSTLGKITCSTHLKKCPRCRQMMDELLHEDDLISELKDSINTIAEASASLDKFIKTDK